MARSSFPLRIRNDRLRELIREVAEREGISQNELLEEAAEHEVVARGALLADQLEASAAHLRAVTSATLTELVESSIVEFAAGEALPDPLRAARFDPPSDERTTVTRRTSAIGAVAAFSRR